MRKSTALLVHASSLLQWLTPGECSASKDCTLKQKTDMNLRMNEEAPKAKPLQHAHQELLFIGREHAQVDVFVVQCFKFFSRSAR